jgi:HSP20 family protein
MYPFDNDRNKRRRDPFDFFGFDDEFERMFRNMERMWERTFRDLNFDQIEPGKSFVHGFNIHIGPDGKPRIEEFGNRPKKIDEGKTVVSDERKPLTDIIEGDDDIFITVEIPGVDKEDINLNISDISLDINVDSPNRKYQKSIDLPCTVIPNKSKATYKNGILDIIVKRKEKKKDGEGYHISID